MDYIKARRFAIIAHGDQKYDGMPYAFHLSMVADIAMNTAEGHHLPWSMQEIHDVAWLHDVMEDTPVEYDELVFHFGEKVAKAVEALSEPKTGTRSERHAATYPKITRNALSLYVKLCDRLANVTYGKKNDMYKKEYNDFVIQLFCSTDHPAVHELWSQIEQILYPI